MQCLYCGSKKHPIVTPNIALTCSECNRVMLYADGKHYANQNRYQDGVFLSVRHYDQKELYRDERIKQ